MRGFAFTILIALLMTPLIALPTRAKAQHSCEFYSDKAQELGCSASNYLLRFGYRYCKAFDRVHDKFTNEGRAAMACIKPCLIDDLSSQSLTCSNVQAIAQENHIACYVSCGYCPLKNEDKMRIAKVVWREFFNKEFIQVADRINKSCGFLEPDELLSAKAIDLR